ncbi:MAG: hypothetical protein AAE977_05200 [Thermoplasmataceae archaeon]
MTHNQNLVIGFFIAAVIIGVIFDFILLYHFSLFFGSNIGSDAAPFISAFMATGIASGAFTISLVLYPVFRKEDKTYKWEDFR